MQTKKGSERLQLTCHVKSTLSNPEITCLKPCHTIPAKDEICRACNLALFIVLISLIGKESILESIEGAAIVSTGYLCTQGNGLRGRVCKRRKSVLRKDGYKTSRKYQGSEAVPVK